MLGTLILYFFIICFCFLLCRQAEKTHSKNGVFFSYCILLFITVFRFDIGNDYEQLTYLINEIITISNGELSSKSISLYLMYYGKEPTLYLLCLLCQWFPQPYVVIVAIYGFISILFLYKALEDNKAHTYGILLFLVSGMIFCYWDWVRQSVSMSIFLFSIKYIKSGQFGRYVLFIGLATLFHFSAFLMLPMFFLRFIKPRPILFSCLLLFALYGFYIQFFTSFFHKIIPYIPYYSETQNVNSWTLNETFSSFNYLLRLCFLSIVVMFSIFRLKKSDTVISNVLFVGILLYIMSQGTLNIQRVAVYPFFSIIIAFPLAIKKIKPKLGISKLLVISLLISYLFLFSLDILTEKSRGCAPYDTIFSPNFEQQIFRIR